MALARPAALVLARGPGADGLRPELEPQLGATGIARLQAVLIGLAAEWAVAVAPGRALIALDPPEEIAGLPAGVELVSGGPLLEVARAAFERFGGPLLIAGVDAPRLDPQHARAALADLAGGAAASFGPGMDGGWYLTAIARWLPELFEAGWEGDQLMPRALALAQQLQIEVGVLRMERLVRTARDVAALLADPLTPRDVRKVLEMG